MVSAFGVQPLAFSPYNFPVLAGKRSRTDRGPFHSRIFFFSAPRPSQRSPQSPRRPHFRRLRAPARRLARPKLWRCPTMPYFVTTIERPCSGTEANCAATTAASRRNNPRVFTDLEALRVGQALIQRLALALCLVLGLPRFALVGFPRSAISRYRVNSHAGVFRYASQNEASRYGKIRGPSRIDSREMALPGHNSAYFFT